MLCAVSLMVSCASPPVGEPRAVSRIGDPLLDGKDYLLSEAEFRAILTVMRSHLSRSPWYAVHRVHVLTATSVEVYVGDPDQLNYEPGVFELTRTKNGWKVVSGGFDRVIVT